VPAHADPLASLGPCPIDVAVGGKYYTIPAEPASRWLAILLDDFGTFASIIDLLSVPEKADIEQDIIDEKIEPGDLERAFQDAVEVASGRVWWVVLNYLSLAQGFWARFHGRILTSGMNIEQVSLGAYLDAMHYTFIEGRDEQALQKILNFLDTPPPGVKIDLDEDVEGQTFLSMLNSSR
jgi:hypothetical protein